ncbi:MAG: DNA repair and recombination protein RadB [Methanobacteriota archaeon]|nr:MAG: DNA repair and recombination protein RadB [Euryarchaeota archaeon]
MKVKIECKSLDDLLEGGVESGCLTLLYGEAGSGKTNICLQLARNVGKKKKVAYIDTEGVSTERLKQICGKNYDKIMRNILFWEATNMDEQEEAIEKVVNLAESNPRIGLVVFDSATIHFRVTKKTEERFDRKALTSHVSRLLALARKKDLPIVLTSQVYTDIERGTYEPLGGHMLTHNAKSIIRLEKIGPNARRATVMKHRHLAEANNAEFMLTDKGVEC